MSGWMYLSFADDHSFRGACVVRADDFMNAVVESHRRGCNPGGEVLGLHVPPEELAHIPDSMRNRLLTKEEAENLGAP